MTRHRELAAAIPHISLCDVTGLQVIAGSTWMTWDTTLFKTDHFHYEKDENRIILLKNSYGLFDIIAECSIYSTTSAGHVPFTLYKNGVALPGGTAYATAAALGQTLYRTCMSIQRPVELEKNDYIQLNANASTYGTLPDSSRIQIKFIPIYGWDNQKGGRMEYSGVIR